MKKQTPRKKLKTNTPITIAIPKAQMLSIAKVPRISFKRFQDGIADVNDWYNLSFRVKVGLYLADKFYTEEAVIGLTLAAKMCNNIGARWLSDKVVTATNEELVDIEAALDAVDQIDGENIRRYILEAMYSARDSLSGKITEVKK